MLLFLQIDDISCYTCVTRWKTRAIFSDVILRARNACAEIRWRKQSLGTQDAECATLGHRSLQEWGVLAESAAYILPSFAAAAAAVAAAAAKRPNWSWNTARGAREAPGAVAWRAPFLGPLSAALSRSLMLGRVGVSSYPRAGFAAIPLVAFCFFSFSRGDNDTRSRIENAVYSQSQ